MPEFARSVFINCPFDKTFEPILQSVLFCIVYLGFTPRIATESADSGAVRLEKIKQLVFESKYSVHDLSRIQAQRKGEHFRLNMPFELGLDYGCRQFAGDGRDAKKILILEEKPYRYQAAISDLAGCDIQSHGANFSVGVRKVRNWLVSESGVRGDGATRILDAYTDFQGWYYEEQRAAGFSDADIQDYPTRELLDAMNKWFGLGRPLGGIRA